MRPSPQLLGVLAAQRFQQPDRRPIDARPHRLGGVCAIDRMGFLHRDLRQLGRMLVQRRQRQVKARTDRAADKHTGLIDQVDRYRRAEIGHHHRILDHTEGRGGGDQPVCADLKRTVHAGLYRQRHIPPDEFDLFAQQGVLGNDCQATVIGNINTGNITFSQQDAWIVLGMFIEQFILARRPHITYNANERHTTKFLKRDWIYKHLSFSTQYRSGIQTSITSVDGSGDLDAHNQFSVTTGTLSDEDIDFSVAAILTAAIKNVWYYNGTIWVKGTGLAGSGVLNAGTGRAAYNNIASGLVECTNNYHVLTHVFAANNGEILCIVGNAQYLLLADARIAASEEIATLLNTGLPFPEFRAIATYISKTSDGYASAVKSKIVSVDTGVPFIDWRETALNPVAGSAASNHQNLSGLQGGQAGEYYHLTAAKYGNVVNNIFPAGTASDTQNKILLPTATTAQWAALTPTETLLGWDSTKKKPVVADGTSVKPIGGGLIATPIDKDFAGALESGKHYLYNGAGMAADKTIAAPAIAAESYIRVTVYNIPTGYKLILDGNGSEKFIKDDTEYDTIEFRAVEVEQSSSFVSTNTNWLVDDGTNALGTVWSGALQVAGDLTGNGNISFDGGSFVFNESGADKDARFEGDTDSNLLFVDAGNDRIGIGLNSPASKLHLYQNASSGLLSKFENVHASGSGATWWYSNTGAGGIGQLGSSNTSYGAGVAGWMYVGAITNNGVIFLRNNAIVGGYDASDNWAFGNTPTGQANTKVTIYQSGSNSNLQLYHAASTSSATMLYLNSGLGSGALSTGNFIYCADGGTAQFKVTGQGVIYAQNTTVQSISDVSTKENIRDLDKGLDCILSLKPRRFDFIEGWGANRKNVMGFIAQECEEVVPEIVDETEFNKDTGEKKKTIGTSDLIPVLVKAIQEQQKQIEKLEAEIAEMRGK